MRRPAAALCAALLLTAPGRADTIVWYNGDPRTVSASGETAATNGVNGSVFVYDDFNLATATTLTRVFGQFYAINNPGTTQAAWEVRSGVSAGNGGTLVASGTSAATLTPLPASPLNKFGLYQVDVPNLSVALGAGTYWLGLSPTIATGGSMTQSTFVAYTDGANAVGTPAGDNGNSFTTGAAIGQNFALYNQIGLRDVSYGVASSPGTGTGGGGSGGTPGNVPGPLADPAAVPEPGTLAVVGLLGLAGAIARRRAG